MTKSIGLMKQFLLSLLIAGIAIWGWSEQDLILSSLGFAQEQTNAGSERRRGGGREVPVIVERVSTQSNSLDFTAVGTGRAHRSIMLRSEDAGTIVEMAIASGASFDAGDVLMRLDNTAQKLAIDLARARKEQADRVFARFEQLRRSGNAPISSLDEARSGARIAEIELNQALEAEKKRVLRAPFAGVTGLAAVETGAQIDTDTEITSYDDRSVLLVEFDLPEALLSRVSVGMAVTGKTPTSPNGRYGGQVIAVDSRITAANRTAKVRVAIENSNDTLRPGASFEVVLPLKGEVFPVVPELAIQFANDTLFVWRVQEGKAQQVDVTMVRRRNASVLIDGPLKEGDLIVIEGTQRLNEGRAVNVLNAPSNAQPQVPAS